MLVTLFYLGRHVMESKNYFWELIFILIAHKGIDMIFADWTVFCWKTCMIWPRTSKFSSKNMFLTLFYLNRHVIESKKLFLRINLHINAHKGIETIFCWLDRLLLKNVYDLAKNYQIFFKNMLVTLFYLGRHVMESKKLFLRINLHINAH